MQFFRRLQPRKRVKPSIAILFYHRDVRLCRLLIADINVFFVLWHWNLPEAFASASRRLKVDLILLGQLIIQRDPGRSRIAKKNPCRPTTSGKSLKKRLGPRPTLRHWYLHHLVESGTLEKPPFLRLQHISLHISLSALQGIPPWSSTVCPWKFMVGRLYLFIGKGNFSGAMLNFGSVVESKFSWLLFDF